LDSNRGGDEGAGNGVRSAQEQTQEENNRVESSKRTEQKTHGCAIAVMGGCKKNRRELFGRASRHRPVGRRSPEEPSTLHQPPRCSHMKTTDMDFRCSMLSFRIKTPFRELDLTIRASELTGARSTALHSLVLISCHPYSEQLEPTAVQRQLRASTSGASHGLPPEISPIHHHRELHQPLLHLALIYFGSSP
jgi:hypothetical protein